MIDIATEQPIPLNQVPKLKCIPRRRAGKRLHISTVHRWATRGLQGVKLETIRFGGTLCTSIEAIQRFCDTLSDPEPPPIPCRVYRPPATRQRAHDQATQQLEREGF